MCTSKNMLIFAINNILSESQNHIIIFWGLRIIKKNNFLYLKNNVWRLMIWKTNILKNCTWNEIKLNVYVTITNELQEINFIKTVVEYFDSFRWIGLILFFVCMYPICIPNISDLERSKLTAPICSSWFQSAPILRSDHLYGF